MFLGGKFAWYCHRDDFKEFCWNSEVEHAPLGVNTHFGDQTLHTKVWYTVLTLTVIHAAWKQFVLSISLYSAHTHTHTPFVRENRIETWNWIGLMDNKDHLKIVLPQRFFPSISKLFLGYTHYLAITQWSQRGTLVWTTGY